MNKKQLSERDICTKYITPALEKAGWVVEVVKKGGPSGHSGESGHIQEQSTEFTASTKVYPEFSANAALVLLAVACSLLDRQVERLAQDFEKKGGFTERLYRVRTAKRRSQP
ncbi:MAG: four helix bundle suffix domain-containing protein [Pseudomonadota bacterium]